MEKDYDNKIYIYISLYIYNPIKLLRKWVEQIHIYIYIKLIIKYV